MRTIFQRAREVLREEGPRSLAFRTVGEMAYRRVVLFEMDLTAAREERPPPAGLHFEQLRPEIMRDFLAIAQLCDEAEARRRLAAGHVCIVGYVEKQPAYCGWLALAGQPVRIEFLRIEAEPAPRCAYTYEIHVDPAFRRSGIARAALDVRIRLLRRLGIERMAAVVVPENRAGIGLTLAAGLRPIGSVHAIRVLGFQRCRLRSDAEPAPLRILR